MSDAGAARCFAGLLLFAAAYSWLKPAGSAGRGWLPCEIADGELAFAERRFESALVWWPGSTARIAKAANSTWWNWKTRGYFGARLGCHRALGATPGSARGDRRASFLGGSRGGQTSMARDNLGLSAWTCSTRTRSWRCAEGCSSSRARARPCAIAGGAPEGVRDKCGHRAVCQSTFGEPAVAARRFGGTAARRRQVPNHIHREGRSGPERQGRGKATTCLR